MGANNVIPTVPFFSGNTAASITQLNQLSYATSFIIDCDIRPVWMFFMYSGQQSITAATWTSIAYDHVAVDSDGVAGSGHANLPNAKIVTQGYYALSACTAITTNTDNADMYTTAFLITGGGNNPNLTTGTAYYMGYKGNRSSNTTEAPSDNAVCISDMTPFPLYPLDTVTVQVYLSAAHSINVNTTATQTAYNIGRIATKFSGQWLREGP